MNACSFNIIMSSSGFERSCIFVTHLLMIGNLARSHSKIVDCFIPLTFFFFLSAQSFLRRLRLRLWISWWKAGNCTRWNATTTIASSQRARVRRERAWLASRLDLLRCGPSVRKLLRHVLFANKRKKSSHRRTFNPPFITWSKDRLRWSESAASICTDYIDTALSSGRNFPVPFKNLV